MNEVWLRVNKGGLFKAKSMNEVDAGRDRATPASHRHDDALRHDDDEPPTPGSPNYCRGSWIRRTGSGGVDGVFHFLVCIVKIGVAVLGVIFL